MPITITIADFQAALAACAQAIRDQSWVTAWLKYAEAEAINAGLDTTASAPGGFMRAGRYQLLGLKDAIEAGQKGAGRVSDNRRFIRGQTGFGR